ncbi:putative inactive purple acid phosphatase 27 [Platanthera zijinensis]|uniref:Inactive purple acid phosphatase 27 n=1 Tax=Platanthera zijinensis TaxID=2320716 RepID=A0AAP0AUX1_9ASPA
MENNQGGTEDIGGASTPPGNVSSSESKRRKIGKTKGMTFYLMSDLHQSTLAVKPQPVVTVEEMVELISSSPELRANLHLYYFALEHIRDKTTREIFMSIPEDMRNTCLQNASNHYHGIFRANTHVIVGGGGAGLANFSPFQARWSHFRDHVFGFVKLTAFNHSILLFEYKKSRDGNVYDHFTITRDYPDLLASIGKTRTATVKLLLPRTDRLQAQSEDKGKRKIDEIDNFFAPRTSTGSQPSIKSVLASKKVVHRTDMAANTSSRPPRALLLIISFAPGSRFVPLGPVSSTLLPSSAARWKDGASHFSAVVSTSVRWFSPINRTHSVKLTFAEADCSPSIHYSGLLCSSLASDWRTFSTENIILYSEPYSSLSRPIPPLGFFPCLASRMDLPSQNTTVEVPI